MTQRMARRSTVLLRNYNNNLRKLCSLAGHNQKTPDLLVYDHIKKGNVPLLPSKNKQFLTWYSCGPTVYDVTHIGHASSYVRLDIMQRIISNWYGILPIVAMSVTDVDDKIITKAKLENVDFRVIAQKYEIEFFSAMKKLNVRRPTFVLRVTDHIDEIIKYVAQIIKRGHAYQLNDGSVYFNTQSFPDYGKVTKTPTGEPMQSKEGGRLHPADFALWKAVKPGEPSWESPWGPGRPGWHIECSTMASKVFGSNVNVHSGGLDLAFPHHENEEAQSCSYHSIKNWVDHWIHTGHMLMNGIKMSKSMKNFLPVSEFLKTYNGDQFRMLCLMTHYRTSIDYSEEVMRKPVAMLDKLTTFLSTAKNYQNGSWIMGNISPAKLLKALSDTKNKMFVSIAKDFNTAQAINDLEELVREVTAMLQEEPRSGAARDVMAISVTTDFVENFLTNIGLLQNEKQGSEEEADNFVIDKSVHFRGIVREIALTLKTESKGVKSNLLKACDDFRIDLAAIGVEVKDTKQSSTWSKHKPPS